MIEHKKYAIVLVFNEKSELALQLRALHDKSFPGHWDFSAGGGIEAGEEIENAAERELKEELGIETEIKFMSEEHIAYPDKEVILFIYKARYNGPFSPNPKEVEKVMFFSLDQINEMIRSRAKFHPDFESLWNRGVVQAIGKR